MIEKVERNFGIEVRMGVVEMDFGIEMCKGDKMDFEIEKPDATGRMGCTPIQKMIAAIRILAYGISVDHCDEYIKVGERIAIESLKRFCDAVIALYAEQYLHSPNESDITRLLQEGEERGFPDHSPVFNRIINGTMPPVNYEIRWAITHGPVYYWKKEDLSKIMRTCIILHNMIIEDEGDTNILEWTPPTDELVYLPQYNRD
ncbi:uncharacterized protein LOC132309492 [Cornus florida]|uniref:uncharacterized protein LOC132309492 n=1 Tax=Cornus florida TaxID=4283 RepID=UPI002898035F|nr:uncharacterized protein LOC132309492 [Cornus florida]